LTLVDEDQQMVALNKVLIAGHLTRKPELRKTPNGIFVTDLYNEIDPCLP
jgi:hypothetical protein